MMGISDEPGEGILAGDRRTVSVVIATRSRPELLKKALSAVAAQQYDGNVETIVVFDQSEPDHSFESARCDRTVRTIGNCRTPGLAGARNTGALEATGEFLAFCDDDDEWLPNKLAAQVQALASHPDADVAVGGIIVSYKGKYTVRIPDQPRIDYATLLRERVTAAHPSTVIARSEAFRHRIGLVDEELPGSYAEDYEWLLRAAKQKPVLVVPEPLALVRWGAMSFFADRWETIIAAIDYLVSKHPDFARDHRGLAYLYGRKAFAHAALGNRKQARRCATTTLRLSWREPRGYIALVVGTGLLSAQRVMDWAHRAGRGI